MLVVGSSVNEEAGIYGEAEFISKYRDYVRTHENCKFIMIDLTKFKGINDTFGHNVGDQYLIYFSKLLLKHFDRSLVARLHGDEYALVTDLNELEIKSKLLQCKKEIKKDVDNIELPRLFSFNSGSADAKEDMILAAEQADYMMYQAKRNGFLYQSFNESYWVKHQAFVEFQKDVDNLIKTDGFEYYVKPLYTVKEEPCGISEIYIKNVEGLEADVLHKYLNESSRIVELDLYKVKKLNEINLPNDDKKIISIDYYTAVDSLKFEDLITSEEFIPNNIIIAINLNYAEEINVNKLSSIIESIKNKGIKVMLKNVNENLPDSIWLRCTPDYIGFSQAFSYEAMNNSKTKYLMQKKLELYTGFNDESTIVYGNIFSPFEFEIYRFNVPDKSLYDLEYKYSQKLTLKK